MRFPITWLLAPLLVLIGCGSEPSTLSDPAPGKVFEKRLPAYTGIEFANMLSEQPTAHRNVLLYEYFSNGSGVAAGDVNGDGLDDLYFVGNMSYNTLYLNKGQLRFDNVTSTSGVGGRANTWKTGAAMADVNGDGRLDIYVCYSGDLPLDRRVDELYINVGNDSEGNPQFEERAEAYGLAHPHSSNQPYFFDFDRDGDLDLFLLTHNVKSLPLLDADQIRSVIAEDDPVSGVRFYRNEGDQFVDITRSTGISSSSLTYGLGAGVSDINNDGWMDIYIGNDYSPPDYLYINQKDGTFRDELSERMGHTSNASMGVDVADINNDGWLDILVLDMLSEGISRQKTQYIVEDRSIYTMIVESGFHHQYMRNTLQLNQGAGYFSEIGQLAGISNTDWSWTPLIADFNNDGLKDIFISNGTLHDAIDRDFLAYKSNYIRSKGQGLQREDVAHLMSVLPSSEMSNYLFQNKGDLTFEDVSNAWGIAENLRSTGVVYSDLDLDGDLDLVTNNMNEYAFVFENTTPGEQNYLQIDLKGAQGNTQGIGAKVIVHTGGKTQYLEQMPSRGYLSSVSPILHVGLGDASSVDSLSVVWPSGMQQLLYQVAVNQRLALDESDASTEASIAMQDAPLLVEPANLMEFEHSVPLNTDDFQRQPLLVQAKSTLGPALSTGDVNGDGLDDVFVGGGPGQAGVLFMQEAAGRFVRSRQPAFAGDAAHEDVDALFFDADANGTLDLYVVSGGYGTYGATDPLLQDRLYVNDGSGLFSRATESLPEMQTSTSTVQVLDIDEDGRPDLFVGGYVVPGQYPETPQSYVLMNDGEGRFTDETSRVASELSYIGMVHDAQVGDLEGDGKIELVIAGAWMPITVFRAEEGILKEVTTEYFQEPLSGLWTALHLEDLNEDGQLDVLAGNLGLNSQLKAGVGEPVELYFSDFNNDGSIDPLLTFYVQGVSYPFVTLEALNRQMPVIASQFGSHRSFSQATIREVLPPERLAEATRLEATLLETSLFLNGENGMFEKHELPVEAQFSPVFSISVMDVNGDSIKDVLLGGNIASGPVRLGRQDANLGIVLLGTDAGGFQYVAPQRSGFWAGGEVRGIIGTDGYILVARRGESLLTYSIAAE